MRPADAPYSLPSMPYGMASDGANAGRIIPRDLATGGTLPTNATFMYGDNKTTRLIIGQRPTNGNIGVYVSESGVDVKSATDAQLILNSDQDMFKIVDKMPITLSVTAAGGTGGFAQTTLAHHLGYTPSIIADIAIDPGLAAFSVGGTANLGNPALTYGLVGGTVTIFSLHNVTVDATNITFSIQLGSIITNGTYPANTATVYLLQETFA